MNPVDLGEDEIEFYETQFLSMQQQIFLDMGSMNTAYLDGGMGAINEMAEAGIFDNEFNVNATEQVVGAWQAIDDPDSTPEELHDAAYWMAFREQHDIIQDDYDQMYRHFPSGPVVTAAFSTFGEVSVPGAHTMGEYDPWTATGSIPVKVEASDMYPYLPENPWFDPEVSVGEVDVTVTAPIASGNVANWDDRWDYFTHDTLPAYIDLLENPQPGQSMGDITSRDMGDRIDDYRIYNRLDSITQMFVDHTRVDVDNGLHLPDLDLR